MGFGISKYSTINSCLNVSKGLVENQQMNYELFSLEAESSKFWSVKYTKMRTNIGTHFFQKVSLYFAVKITISTRIVNRFMNYSPTAMFTIRLSHKCRSGDVNFAKFCRF